jgi:hypothetical protein
VDGGWVAFDSTSGNWMLDGGVNAANKDIFISRAVALFENGFE